MIYRPFEIVEVPFPFSDQKTTKRRKALVISNEEFQSKNNALILIMITSATHSHWVGDINIEHWQTAGLKKPCIARLKIFTLDSALVIGSVGYLIKPDQEQITVSIKKYLIGN
jgi:mRNA interferase MazF